MEDSIKQPPTTQNESRHVHCRAVCFSLHAPISLLSAAAQSPHPRRQRLTAVVHGARRPHHPTQPNMLGRQSSRSSTATSPWSPDDETIRDLPSTQPTHARGSLSRRGLGAGPAGSLLRPIASAPPDGEASVVLDRRPVPVPASTCPWIITY